MDKVKPRLRLFIAEHCTPCQELKQFAENGELGDIEVIDIESEEGFAYLQKMDIDEVPSIFKDDFKCSIKHNQETDTIDIICPEDGSNQEEAS